MAEKQNNAEKTAVQVFEYEGKPISFDPEQKNVMVNATEMAKPFGKRVSDWLNNQQTKDFIDELSRTRKSVLADLVTIKNGGTHRGTWLHEDVALEFAHWLSPKFAIWCNDRIKELLKYGLTTATSNGDMVTMPRSEFEVMKDAMNEIEARSQEYKRRIDHTFKLCIERIEELKKSEHMLLHQFLPGTSPCYTIKEAAERLMFRTYDDLLEELIRLGFLRVEDGKWFPVEKYTNELCYFTTRYLYKDEDERNGGNYLVTTEGLVYFHSIFDPSVFATVLNGKTTMLYQKGGEE